MNILLTVEELAKYLKIKPDTIYKKVRRGELPAIRLGKLVRFPREAIDQWLADQATRTMKEVRATMKEVRAARHAVESRVGEAVTEMRRTAKAATKVMNEVPEVLEDVRNAPLKKKQKVLAKGLRTLWNDLNDEVAKTPVRARAKKTAANGRKKPGRKGRRPVRASSAPHAQHPTNA